MYKKKELVEMSKAETLFLNGDKETTMSSIIFVEHIGYISTELQSTYKNKRNKK